MSLTQAIEAKPRKEPCDEGLAQDGRSRCLFALAIEAEWRKHAAGVVPAQPKARPEGQRTIGTPLAPHPDFPLCLKLNEPIAAAFRTILGQERRQADQKDEPQSIFLTKLQLFWSRPTASAPRRRRVPRR